LLRTNFSCGGGVGERKGFDFDAFSAKTLAERRCVGQGFALVALVRGGALLLLQRFQLYQFRAALAVRATADFATLGPEISFAHVCGTLNLIVFQNESRVGTGGKCKEIFERSDPIGKQKRLRAGLPKAVER
jgi:hypothetical protein